jgi:hypothetical protein
MNGTAGLSQFVHGGRVRMQFDGKEIVRAVHRAQVVRRSEASTLEGYMADRLPYFYKEPGDIASAFGEGYFLTAFKEVLQNLPDAPTFRESHFGEIIAAEYAEAILGLKRIYSKLALLTSENTNALKMDILLYRPGTDPVQFVLAEVKSSMKTAKDGLPACHDKSCFPSLFASFNSYSQKDLDFDLGRIKERFGELPDEDRRAISDALQPHRTRQIEYAGFCVIDNSTHDENESALLGARKNKKVFDVDLLCIAELPDVVVATYEKLGKVA